LLDEPTGDLDTRNTVDIMDLLLHINLTKRTTLLMVTHNPDIECYADRCLYLRDGRIQRQAVNARQRPLDYDQYIAYLNALQNAHVGA
jgi:putative ABC transport system ATP-binding protein